MSQAFGVVPFRFYLVGCLSGNLAFIAGSFNNSGDTKKRKKTCGYVSPPVVVDRPNKYPSTDRDHVGSDTNSRDMSLNMSLNVGTFGDYFAL